MSDTPSIQKIEERCRGILGSPYLIKQLPDELRNLRLLLKTVEQMAREDVPYLVSEVKRLRALNKQLEANIGPPEEIEAEASPPIAPEAEVSDLTTPEGDPAEWALPQPEDEQGTEAPEAEQPAATPK